MGVVTVLDFEQYQFRMYRVKFHAFCCRPRTLVEIFEVGKALRWAGGRGLGLKVKSDTKGQKRRWARKRVDSKNAARVGGEVTSVSPRELALGGQP